MTDVTNLKDPHERALEARDRALEGLGRARGGDADWKTTTIVFALLAIEARLEEIADNVGGVSSSIELR